MTRLPALAHSDAAYVLGALSPAERLGVRAAPARLRVLPPVASPSWPACPACSAGSRRQVEGPPPVEPLPATVLPALVAAVRREQRRKSVLVTLGGGGRGRRRGRRREGAAGRPRRRAPVPAGDTSTSSVADRRAGPADGRGARLRRAGRRVLTRWAGAPRWSLTCSYAMRTSDYGEAATPTSYRLVVSRAREGQATRS